MYRLTLFTPVYLLTFISMHTFILNIVQSVGLVGFLNDFELVVWRRMYGKKNPLESHHNFRSIKKRNVDEEHTSIVRQHSKRLSSVKNLYGADSTQFKQALDQVHDDLDSDTTASTDVEDDSNSSSASSKTKVVPNSPQTTTTGKV